MKFIRETQNPSGAYPPIQESQMEHVPEGCLLIPEDLDISLFYTCAGFVSLAAVGGAVTGMEVNEAAYAAWQAEQTPEDPEAVLAAEVRAQRDALLEPTDKYALLDAPIDAQTREAIYTYRQALRDVPEQAGFPGDVVWPEVPAIMKAAPDPVDAAFDVMTGGDTNA